MIEWAPVQTPAQQASIFGILNNSVTLNNIYPLLEDGLWFLCMHMIKYSTKKRFMTRDFRGDVLFPYLELQVCDTVNFDYVKEKIND